MMYEMIYANTDSLLGESKAENTSLLEQVIDKSIIRSLCSLISQLNTLQAELTTSVSSKHATTVATSTLADYQQQLLDLQTRIHCVETDYYLFYSLYQKLKPVVDGVGVDTTHVELCTSLSACLSTSMQYLCAVRDVAVATGCRRLVGLQKDHQLKYEKMESKEVAVVMHDGCDAVAGVKQLLEVARHLSVTSDFPSNILYLVNQYRTLMQEKIHRIGKDTTKQSHDIENIVSKLTKAVKALPIDDSGQSFEITCLTCF